MRIGGRRKFTPAREQLEVAPAVAVLEREARRPYLDTQERAVGAQALFR
jgi:hypothetical protein